MIFQHHRFQVWNKVQHPYVHQLSDFLYSHDALPPGSVTTVEQALNWLFAVLYPNQKDAVANVAALPAVGNTLNDMRVVLDDGDTKAATYRWEQREGDASAKWYKIYDMDWGYDSILSGFLTQTQDMYVNKYGRDDLDDTGTALTGVNAGQHIYGGLAANSHLTLHANAGDGVGAQTGFIQFADQVRAVTDSVVSLGTTGVRWLKVWTDALTSGTMTMGDGSITDSSGAISFNNENLSTTGTLASGTHTIGNMVIATGSITNTGGSISFADENLSTTGTLASGTHTIGTLVLAAGSITDSGGSISFGDENLSTTGTLSAGATTVAQLNVDLIRIDANSIVTFSNTDLTLSPHGTGNLIVEAPMIAEDISSDGLIQSVTLEVGLLAFSGSTIASITGNNVIIDPNGAGLIELGAAFFPTTDSTWDIGKTGNVWNKLWLDGSIGDGTTEITSATLQSLRDINSGVSSGMSIFWNGSKWVASAPDTEIDHGSISGLTDDDHTQYALLAGRSGGQTLYGGTAASNNLTLRSTSNATKGDILAEGDFVPFTDATFDLGITGTARWKDLYMTGQAIGLRVENYTTAGRPSATAGTAGRMYFDTTVEDLYINRAGTWKKASLEKYVIQDASGWTGTETSAVYTVSSEVSDARECVWVFKSNSGTFEQLAVQITMSQTQVTVTTSVPLPSGTYTLVGVG